MSRPGVMLYFDTRKCLKRLDLQQKGALFEAILDYGEFGVVPDFSVDAVLGVAWDFLEPRIDRDGERYETSVLQRQYAAYCKSCKRTGAAPVDFSTWRQNPLQAPAWAEGRGTVPEDSGNVPPEEQPDNGTQRPLSDVDGQQPTTTPTPAPSPSPTPAPSPDSNTAWPPSGDFNSRRNAWLDVLGQYGG